MNVMCNVIIDCDFGIDDSLVLLLVFKLLVFNVIGIIIVCGNVLIYIGVENVLKILDLVD